MANNITAINSAFKKLGYVKIISGKLFQREDKNGACVRTVSVDNNVVTFYAKDICVGNPLKLGVMALAEFLELAA